MEDEVAPLVCVVFEGRDFVQSMADYRVGQQVSVVIERHNWAESTPSQGFLGYARAGTLDESPYWREFCRFDDTYALFWCCRGKGIEKFEQPLTWIDPAFGRTDRISNGSAVNTSFGTILRDPTKFVGTRGLLEAKFIGLLPIFPRIDWRKGGAWILH
jgi:hypothetical protein